MLVENSATVYSLLRQHWKLLPAVLMILIAVEVGNDYIGFDRPALSLATVGLLVSALSIFLAFRINEAYARWWEARILWGNFISASRAFARNVTTLIDVDPADEEGPDALELRRELVYRQIALAHALRLSLRKEDGWEELRSFVDDEEFAGGATGRGSGAGRSGGPTSISCGSGPATGSGGAGSGGAETQATSDSAVASSPSRHNPATCLQIPCMPNALRARSVCRSSRLTPIVPRFYLKFDESSVCRVLSFRQKSDPAVQFTIQSSLCQIMSLLRPDLTN